MGKNIKDRYERHPSHNRKKSKQNIKTSTSIFAKLDKCFI